MYAKLFTSIYQGTLRGNSHGLLVFTNLLAHADKTGFVDVHPRAIADEVGLDIAQVRSALIHLESPDDESRSPEREGRRIIRTDEHRDWGWQIVNYLKYRAIRNEEDRREQNRLAQETWRNKNKQSKPSVSVDKPSKPMQKEKEKEKEKAPQSSHFCNRFQNRTGKASADRIGPRSCRARSTCGFAAATATDGHTPQNAIWSNTGAGRWSTGKRSIVTTDHLSRATPRLPTANRDFAANRSGPYWPISAAS